jgi:hypothetical protein
MTFAEVTFKPSCQPNFGLEVLICAGRCDQTAQSQLVQGPVISAMIEVESEHGPSLRADPSRGDQTRYMPSDVPTQLPGLPAGGGRSLCALRLLPAHLRQLSRPCK